MDKYLLLLSRKNSQFFYGIKNTEQVSVYNIYRDMSIPERVLRKIMIKLRINIDRYYDSWKFDTNDYTKIIMEDGSLDDGIFSYLRKIFPHAQLIYWFRNSLNAVDYVRVRDLHIKHAKLCDRVLSFDQSDSRLLGYEYIENPYVIDKSLVADSLKYDMIFLGSDKSRYESIMHVIRYTEHLGWNNFVYIYSKTKPADKYIGNHFVAYRDYLKEMIKSKAILDIVDVNYQHGYSLRIFEAVFYKKKLISNSKSLLNEPFYHPNNIFIISPDDESSFDGLLEFMQRPWVDVDTEIIKKYDFYNWIKRI